MQLIVNIDVIIFAIAIVSKNYFLVIIMHHNLINLIKMGAASSILIEVLLFLNLNFLFLIIVFINLNTKAFNFLFFID